MHIRALEQYGLTLDALRKLGKKLITVKVALKPQCYDHRLLKLPHKERMKLFRELKRKSIDRSLLAWPNKDVHLSGHKEFPSSFESMIEANKLADYAKGKIYDFIEIIRIPGLRRRRAKKEKELSWYAVRARVAIQVEDQTRGLQTIEDRIVILKAYSAKDAVKRLSKEWKDYEVSTMNLDGFLVRWQMEEVTDVYEIIDREIDSKGTEVYSSLHQRRMKPEYEWHPFAI